MSPKAQKVCRWIAAILMAVDAVVILAQPKTSFDLVALLFVAAFAFWFAGNTG